MRRTVGRTRTAGVLGTACLLAAAGTGCAPQTARSAADGRTVTYWMWDANQRPAYEECAKSFERENPGLTVRITQIGFDNYWTKLMASFLSGTQPDVFTNHPAKYPQFAKLGVLSPLDELGPTAHLRSGDYQPGSRTPGSGRTGTATARRRTGTRSVSSTTERSRERQGSARRSSTRCRGTRATAAVSRRPSPG